MWWLLILICSFDLNFCIRFWIVFSEEKLNCWFTFHHSQPNMFAYLKNGLIYLFMSNFIKIILIFIIKIIKQLLTFTARLEAPSQSLLILNPDILQRKLTNIGGTNEECQAEVLMRGEIKHSFHWHHSHSPAGKPLDNLKAPCHYRR